MVQLLCLDNPTIPLQELGTNREKEKIVYANCAALFIIAKGRSNTNIQKIWIHTHSPSIFRERNNVLVYLRLGLISQASLELTM
jgi:hypothetical protein